jgi:regulator of sigma E protease
VLPTIVIFLIVLSVVVLIHELGHYLAARLTGVRVEEFGFGYPPKVIGRKIGETIYSLNLLPFGGFVRLLGEQSVEESKNPRSFANKSKKQRSVIILAGVAMNILLGVAAFSFIYSVTGIPEQVDYITIEAIAPNSPAESAGLERGDKVVAINGNNMDEVRDFVEYLEDKKGEQVRIQVVRNSEFKQINLTPRENPPEGEGAVGVVVSNYDNKFYPWWQMPFRASVVGVQEAYGWTRMMVEGLVSTIAGIFEGVRPEVAGVVGIYQITSTVAQEGILPIIKFVGILSLNLAVINILPFPALDGGRFVFILLEKVIGKKMRPKLEAYINMAGMAILIALMVLITIGDILRIVRGG